ncbi:MAG: nicotinamide-nucleotide amidohydrolase family protein [Methylophilaceae bacterium]|nr:nicotinamide-nucleotide amidohydrolase family protein [Methylophilaceae bacterium]
MDDSILLALANQLGKILKQRGLKLALAESCTGGMASQYITAIAGSSAWLDRAFITYSNQAKVEMLHVSEQTLANFGAVSEQTAHEMALGTLSNSGADISASITGIAGPNGGTEDKPVGTVCFGFALKNKLLIDQTNPQVSTHTKRFSGSRDAIRKQSVTYTLETLITLTLSIDL